MRQTVEEQFTGVERQRQLELGSPAGSLRARLVRGAPPHLLGGDDGEGAVGSIRIRWGWGGAAVL